MNPCAMWRSVLLMLLIYSISTGFGKNKVQYTDFSWNAITTPHFVIHTHQNEETLAAIAPLWIERDYRDLSSRFQYSHKKLFPLIIYGNTNLFTQTNIITELLPEGVGGFTELFKNRIAIPFNGSYKDFRHVLNHELVHAVMFGMLFEQFGSNMLAGNMQLPLWFMEGSAEYLSSRWDTDADMFMIDQALNSVLPLPGAGLDGYLAYKGGQSFLFFLESSRGDSLFGQFLLEFKKSRRVDAAIKTVYHLPLEKLGKEWTRELRRLYWPEIGCRIDPANNARPITKHTETRDHFNLRPRISPDGSLIAFFSDRRDYTKILITDTKGKIVHEIGQSGYGGFFESFHPFRSGVCWSTDSKRLAFVTNSNGSDELRIIDIKRKKLEKRLRTSLNSISSPDWSHDGKQMVFTGIDNGKSDLYLYTLATDSMRRLTNSLSCESDPRFSPDGKTIVFAIEDSSGQLPDGNSPYGMLPSDLAILYLDNDSIRMLSSTRWSEKQPCFSPDGTKLLFVANRNGIDNLYIGSPDSLDNARPLTNYTGGCSNPDWSRKDEAVVFSLFQNQAWDVWMISDPLKKLLPDTLTPTRWVASFSDTSLCFFQKAPPAPDSTDSARQHIEDKRERKGRRPKKRDLIYNTGSDLDSTAFTKSIPADTSTKTQPSANTDSAISPPSSPSNDTVNAQPQPQSGDTLQTKPPISQQKTDADSSTAIAADSSDTITVSPPRPYRLSFSPDIVFVGLGMSTAYSPGGQAAISLSDLMGDHRITFAGELYGNLNDYADLYLSYQFLKRRIDLGVAGFYRKYYTYASIFGDRLYHEMQYGGMGVAQYPFSMFSRLDLQVLARLVEQTPYSFDGETLTSKIFQTSLSYVYDNTLWGITGPLNGMRAITSIQVSPPLSVVTEPYISFDADVRHYLHILKRFVWANRLYAGCSLPLKGGSSARRYLLGGNDQWLIYRINTEEYEKNLSKYFYSDIITPLRGWNYFDLSGSRVAVLNSEFRFPFIREITLVWPLPMQIQYISGALFADLGNAWEAGERFGRLPLPEKIYGGFGFGLRGDLGIFILRFDRGWPTDWNTFVGAPTNYFSLGAEF